MNDTKSPLTSLGVWGALTAIAGAAAPLLLDKAGVAPAADSPSVATLAAQAVALAGGILALVGRITATKRIR